MNNESMYFFKFDKRHLKIEISKGSWPQFVLQFIIVWTLLERFLIQMGIPGFIIYLNDVINIILLLSMIKKRKRHQFMLIILAYGLYIICGMSFAFFNYQIWGGSFLFTIIEVRNVIRFPIFMIACVTFLRKSDVEKIFHMLTSFFYINFFIILYQYITYHPAGVWTRGDYLNGFFGISVGGNTYVNVLLLCVVTYWICKWKRGECTAWKFIFPFVMSIIIAALIELKAYFIEIAVLYFWYFVSQKKNVRELIKTIVLIVLMFIAANIAFQYMYQEYPWFRDTMSVRGILKSTSATSGYTGSGDLNRLTAIFTIAKNVFKGDFIMILTGIGLGNGAAYSLGGSLTRFYRMFGSTHYVWFSDVYVFVQSGIIGLFLYICTFVYLFFKRKNTDYSFLSQTMILQALFLLIYNETMKTDAGYLVYLAIAAGFIPCSNKSLDHILMDSKTIKNKKHGE